MKRLKLVLLFLCSFFVLLCIGAYWYAARQGSASVNWSAFPEVSFDTQGIPTITGETWEKVIETQGFVVASERLWQMDLMRRSASGSLAEWFGPRAIPWDEKRRREDWLSVADTAARELPPDEKNYCEAYALGVNRFIRDRANFWSAEYALLGEVPAPWSCRDSILILLSMIEDLTGEVDGEAEASIWRRFLPPAWEQFLFPQAHPWNRPVFSKNRTPLSPIPTPELPRKPIQPGEVKQPVYLNSFTPGSNAWASRGPEGTFLANDPHLSTGVPQIWYAVRLKRSQESWVVGAALPGMPGVVLGRNADIAWGFTNTGEDVDDLLEEELSEDHKQYVVHVNGNRKQWAPLEERPYTIKVRGGPDKKGTALFSARGPVSAREPLGGKYFARRWLAFERGKLRLPTVELMQAQNWAEFNVAVDHFPAPAQAIVFADKTGGIGLRVSGTGVQKKRSGLVPQLAVEADWIALEPVEKRPRIYFPPGTDAKSISTANQRLWVEGWGEHWASDLRQDRITQVLTQGETQSVDFHRRLQLDTFSRFYSMLARWLAKHAVPKTEGQKRLVSELAGWGGVAEKNESVFAKLVFAQAMISTLALGRAKEAFLPHSQQELVYDWSLHSAWELALISESETDPWKAFGLESAEVAQWVLGEVEKKSDGLSTYVVANRWRSQHPFATAVPILGWFFSVDNHHKKASTAWFEWRDLALVPRRAWFGLYKASVWEAGRFPSDNLDMCFRNNTEVFGPLGLRIELLIFLVTRI